MRNLQLLMAEAPPRPNPLAETCREHGMTAETCEKMAIIFWQTAQELRQGRAH